MGSYRRLLFFSLLALILCLCHGSFDVILLVGALQLLTL